MVEDTFVSPVEKAMAYIGGKWKTIIIANLLEGGKRFNALLKSITGISQRALVLQLRELEADGIVVREAKPNNAQINEYKLTNFGQSLQDVIKGSIKWGSKV